MTKEYDLPYYEELFSELKATLPHVSLTALTAVEVDFIARLSKVDHAEALRRLRAAGHDTMPGGGAEVFSPRVRKIIADRKVPGGDLARRAPRGARPGHAHQRDPPVRPLRDARGAGRPHARACATLQDDTGGFQAFIPLPFLPGNTDFAYLPGPTREEKLRTIAVARLFLDSFPHIKGHWVMLGEEITSEALRYGLDDLSGTLTEERIAHATTVQTPLGPLAGADGDPRSAPAARSRSSAARSTSPCERDEVAA